MSDVQTFGVIGCGDIAVSRHLPALVAEPSVRLVAVCDTDQQRARHAAERFGVPEATGDPEQLVADPRIEAVVIATPPWATPWLTIAALRAGKDVLCEKPMATEVADAEEVARVERESRGLVQVGFTYRHGPLFERLRAWIAGGRLGSPVVYRLGIFDEIWDPIGQPAHHGRIMNTLRHGPPCIHDGAHAADQLHVLTGSRVVGVRAFGLTTRPEFPTPNYNLAYLEFANGDRAKLEIGWFFPRFPGGEFEALGPKGLATFHRDRREVVLAADGLTERVHLEEEYFESCFRIQLATFLAARESRGSPGPGTAAGIASLALCKAIEHAMRDSDEGVLAT